MSKKNENRSHIADHWVDNSNDMRALCDMVSLLCVHDMFPWQTAARRRRTGEKYLGPTSKWHRVKNIRSQAAACLSTFCPNSSVAAAKWAEHAAAWLSGLEALSLLCSWGHKQMRCELLLWHGTSPLWFYYLVIIIYKTRRCGDLLVCLSVQPSEGADWPGVQTAGHPVLVSVGGAIETTEKKFRFF